MDILKKIVVDDWTLVGNNLYPNSTLYNVSIGATGTTGTEKFHVYNESVLFDGTSGNTPVAGAGTRMMWIPAKAAFRAGKTNGIHFNDAGIGLNSFACGEDIYANGTHSFAANYGTWADGGYSFSIGYLTKAGGLYSFASGTGTEASGYYSASFNHSTTSSGYGSAAFGYKTTSQPYLSVAIGQYNVVSGSTNSWVSTDPLFQIGNGTGTGSNANNAFTVLKNGATIVNYHERAGTEKLRVYNESVLFDGTSGNTPVTGAGTRFMWIPSKGALRAGVVSGTEWDDSNIGINSIAFGNNLTVNSNYSMGVGKDNFIIYGGLSFVGGSGNTVSGVCNFAYGQDIILRSGYEWPFVDYGSNYNTSFGLANAVEYNYNLVAGYGNDVRGNANIIGGQNINVGNWTGAASYNIAAGINHSFGGSANLNASFGQANVFSAGKSYSLAAGVGNGINGSPSYGFGFTNSLNGDYSFAAGQYLTNNSYNSVVFGTYNVASGTTGSWISTDPLFVIGNGTGAGANSSNAFTVLKNGATIVNYHERAGTEKLRVYNESVLFDGTSGNTPVAGAGTRFMWIPAKSALRAGIAGGTSWDDTNIGANSVSFGEDNRVNGTSSFSAGQYNVVTGNNGSAAFGYNNTSSGQFSFSANFQNFATNGSCTAFGNLSTASNLRAFATGYATTADGYNTASFNDQTTARSYDSTAHGRFNVVSGTTDSWVSTDPLFVIGNGTGVGANASNAFTVLKNGATIVNYHERAGTEKFRVYNESVLFDGTSGNTPVAGAGTRMMWIPAKSALRAGVAVSNKWDDANIGDGSWAGGLNSYAAGSASFAFGDNVGAWGTDSVAFMNANSVGNYTFGAGYSTSVNGQGGIALGHFITSNGQYSFTSNLYTTNNSYINSVFGYYNVATGTDGSWISTDPLFQVGNGTGTGTDSNDAFRLNKNASGWFKYHTGTTAIISWDTVNEKVDINANLNVTGSTSGSTVVSIVGSSGELFSITDVLYGDLLTVSDSAGTALFTVNSNTLTTVRGDLIVDDEVWLTGTTTGDTTMQDVIVRDTDGKLYYRTNAWSMSSTAHTHLWSDLSTTAHTHLWGDLSTTAHTHLWSNLTTTAHTHLWTDLTTTAHTHDDRYYTETESDGRFYSSSGGTIDGTVVITSLISTASTISAVYVDSGGTIILGDSFVDMYITDATIISWITDNTNWTSAHTYTGPSLSGVSSGQKYLTTAYTYEYIGPTLYRNIATVYWSNLNTTAHTHLWNDLTTTAHTHLWNDLTTTSHTHLWVDLDTTAHTHLWENLSTTAHTHLVSDLEPGGSLTLDVLSAGTIYVHTLSGMSPINIENVIINQGVLTATTIHANIDYSNITNKITNLKEVDAYLFASPSVDFAVDTGGTRAVISCTDNTVQVVDLSTMYLMNTLTVNNAGYVRYCPTNGEFWVMDTKNGEVNKTITRISATGTTGSILGTIVLSGTPFYRQFDADDTYVYIGYYDAGTDARGILKIDQLNLSNSAFTEFGGNANRGITTFYRDGAWHLIVIYTYGGVIYDPDYNIECNLSGLIPSYGETQTCVSEDGNYVGQCTTYTEAGTVYKHFNIIDVSDFVTPVKILGENKSYKGNMFLDTDKFIINTYTLSPYFYDNRIIVSDYGNGTLNSYTNWRSYPGVLRQNTSYQSQIHKKNDTYYILFGSNDTSYGSSLRSYKIE